MGKKERGPLLFQCVCMRAYAVSHVFKRGCDRICKYWWEFGFGLKWEQKHSCIMFSSENYHSTLSLTNTHIHTLDQMGQEVAGSVCGLMAFLSLAISDT